MKARPTISNNPPLNPQIVAWADKLRDLAATGLHYTEDLYDAHRYSAIRQVAIEMLDASTTANPGRQEPLAIEVFSRMTPYSAAAGAVIDERGRILLMRRADNGLRGIPAGCLEVGETPAAGVVREILEETAVQREVMALVGVYDSAIWNPHKQLQTYAVTFLCRPSKDRPRSEATHTHETLEIGRFGESELPTEMHPGHQTRVEHAYEFWRGDRQDAYFDP